MYRRGVELAVAAADAGMAITGLIRDAHRDVQLAVRRTLAGCPEQADPRIGIFEDNGITTVYISTSSSLQEQVRAELRTAVRAALSPYTRLAFFTNVVFLTRRMC